MMTKFMELLESRRMPISAALFGFVSVVGLQLLSGPVTARRSVDPTAFPLVKSQDLQYVGAFRVPVSGSTVPTSFNYGGGSLTYWPAHDSLLIANSAGSIAEISIPTPGTSPTLAGLPRATLLQPITDILKGKRGSIDGDTQNGVQVGGILPFGNQLIVNVWSYYDAGQTKQTLTHFITGQNFSALSATDVRGPYQVGTGFQNVISSDSTRIGGFVSGYMTAIPPPFQALLGGTHLTGQGGGVSILVRTSSGPSASAFSPADLGIKMPAPAKVLMGYPSDSSTPGSPLDQPTLGVWGVGGRMGLYDGTQFFRGMAFPDGTRSILFFGWGGLPGQFCYGAATADPSLHFKPNPQGGHYCFDPIKVGQKGTNGYPYRSLVYAYDANDFLAARSGGKKPWEVVPYATWALPTLPFQEQIGNLGFGPVDLGPRDILGASYDPATKRLFITAFRSDGNAPLVHVFQVNAGQSSTGGSLCY